MPLALFPYLVRAFFQYFQLGNKVEVKKNTEPSILVGILQKILSEMALL